MIRAAVRDSIIPIVAMEIFTVIFLVCTRDVYRFCLCRHVGCRNANVCRTRGIVLVDGNYLFRLKIYIICIAGQILVPVYDRIAAYGYFPAVGNINPASPLCGISADYPSIHAEGTAIVYTAAIRTPISCDFSSVHMKGAAVKYTAAVP